MTTIKRSARGSGSGASSRPLATLKIAVLAPIASPRVSSATAVNPGSRASPRAAWLRSWRSDIVRSLLCTPTAAAGGWFQALGHPGPRTDTMRSDCRIESHVRNRATPTLRSPCVVPPLPPAPHHSRDSPRLRWWRWCGWGAWIAEATAIAARFAGRAADDIYITYRYAYNLASGRGLVFNPGERVFGVSDPGIAVLLAGLHRGTGVAIPVLGSAVTAAALLVITGVVLAASHEAGRGAEGWLGGALLLGSAFAWLGQGAGPLPALACLLLAARVAGARPLGAGLLAGLGFCCRPDAALGAAALMLLLVLEAWDRPAPGG